MPNITIDKIRAELIYTYHYTMIELLYLSNRELVQLYEALVKVTPK